MTKARAGERPTGKRTKADTRRSSSLDPALIQQQLDHDIARSIRVDTTVDVCTENASKYSRAAATGNYRPKNSNFNYFQGSDDASAIGVGQVPGTQRENGTGGNNGLSPFSPTNRRDPRRQRRNVNNGNDDGTGNGITSYGHSNISTPAIHLTAVDQPVKISRHANLRNDNKKQAKAPSPSLSPSTRKASSRVGKPKRGSPATDKQRKSKFIEEMMRDKVSTVPPPQFLGEEPADNWEGHGSTVGNEDGKTASATKKHGVLRKMLSSFFRNSVSDEPKSAKPRLGTASPVKDPDSMDDRKAMAEREYEKLKAQGFKGTAKDSQPGMPNAAPVTSAAVDHPVPAFTNTTRSRGLTQSKSFFDISSTKRCGSATYRKLMKKRSNLAEKLAEVDKQLAKVARKEVQDKQPARYSQERDAEMPIVAPGPSRMQNTSQGRHHGHAFGSRSLPSIPSERRISQMAADGETDEQPAAATNTPWDFADKELPPPPCSALKASLKGEKRPKPPIKQTNDIKKTETRKRKGVMVVEEPEFNEDEYLREFRSYDNDKDSDYSHNDGPGTSDTSIDFDYISPERRHLPSRRAKLARTTSENHTIPQETAIPPRRSSRNLRNRYSTDYPVSVTPGEKGHEDVPPVPPVPTKLPKGSGRKKKHREENKENHHDEELDEYQWPEDIF